MLVADQGAFGAHAPVELEKGGVGVEPLFRRPRKTLDDEATVVRVFVRLLAQRFLPRLILRLSFLAHCFAWSSIAPHVSSQRLRGGAAHFLLGVGGEDERLRLEIPGERVEAQAQLP